MAPGRPPHLESALRRLIDALDRLDGAAARLAERGRSPDVDGMLAEADDNRRRLAAELEAAMQQNRALEAAADEVAARIGKVGSTLRRLLDVDPKQGSEA